MMQLLFHSHTTTTLIHHTFMLFQFISHHTEIQTGSSKMSEVQKIHFHGWLFNSLVACDERKFSTEKSSMRARARKSEGKKEKNTKIKT